MAPPTELVNQETFTCQICSATLDGWENVKSHPCFEGTQFLALHPNNVVGRSESKEGTETITVTEEVLDPQILLSISGQVQQDEPAVWSHTLTKELIRLYQTLQDKFNDPSCRKKQLWMDISSRLKKIGCTYNPIQVEGKWKSLCRAYRHAQRVGNVRRSCPFYAEIGEILSNKQDTLTASLVDIDSLLATPGNSTAKELPVFGRERTPGNRYGNSADSQILPEQSETDNNGAFPPIKRRKTARKNDILHILRQNHQDQMEIESQKLQMLQKMHKDNHAVLTGLLQTLKDITEKKT